MENLNDTALQSLILEMNIELQEAIVLMDQSCHSDFHTNEGLEELRVKIFNSSRKIQIIINHLNKMESKPSGKISSIFAGLISIALMMPPEFAIFLKSPISQVVPSLEKTNNFLDIAPQISQTIINYLDSIQRLSAFHPLVKNYYRLNAAFNIGTAKENVAKLQTIDIIWNDEAIYVFELILKEWNQEN